ncbi:MAG: GNAT family N-acetyltransferase [Clostridiales bacterium]|nr:GNAT family N-acetyltransferase [Clostridiales bacterium]
MNGLTCRAAVDRDLPRMKALWQLCFGDEAAEIDCLLSCLYAPGVGLVLEAEGQVQSMLLSLPLTLVGQGGEALPARYVYAFCTHPAAQSRGYGRTLLAWAEEQAAAQGCAAVAMVPGEASLFAFYEGLGYARAFPRQTRKGVPAAAPDAVIAPVPPEEYGTRREALLAGSAHCRYPLPFLEAQQALSLASGGGLYTVTVGNAPYLAAAEGGAGDALVLRELLGPAEAAPAAASALCAALGRGRWLFHAPGQGEPYGVVKWLSGTRVDECYLGLSLE